MLNCRNNKLRQFIYIRNIFLFMPTILRHEGFRFYFFSHENNEPPHIHVDKDNKSAKFWLNEIGLAKNIGYTAKELRKIIEIITDNNKLFLSKWYGYFS
jgi:hypothetical protein